MFKELLPRKSSSLTLLLISLSLIGTVYFIQTLRASSPRQTISIIQTVEHPALNKNRKGLIDSLRRSNPSAQIIWESAQGNPVLATQICQKFVGNATDVIVSLGTMPSQTAVNAVKGKNIPVVFGSVTDPYAAKIDTQSTGVSNFVDVEQQLEKIVKVLPQLKRLGTIYNPGEAFSEKMLTLLKEACAKRGITVVPCTVTKTADVMTAAQSIVSRVEAIFINNDNTVLSAFPTLVKVCDAAGIAAISSDTDSIEQGALLALGANQYKLGEQEAEMVKTLLENPTLAKKIPIAYPKEGEFYVNQDKANQLGIVLSPELQKEIQVIYQKDKK